MVINLDMRQLVFMPIIFVLFSISCNERKIYKIIEENNMNYRVQYYKSGQLRSKVPLKKGVPFGIETQFTKEGTLYKKIAWYEGEIYSHQFEYYPNPDTLNQIQPNGDTILVTRSKLKRYWYINEKKEEVFSANYGSDLKLLSHKGKSTVEYKVNRTRYGSGDSISIRIFYPILEDVNHFNSRLLVFDGSGNQVKETLLDYNQDLSVSDISFVISGDTTLSLAILNNWEFSNVSFADTSYLNTIRLN